LASEVLVLFDLTNSAAESSFLYDFHVATFFFVAILDNVMGQSKSAITRALAVGRSFGQSL
jgi:hypothetical protein